MITLSLLKLQPMSPDLTVLPPMLANPAALSMLMILVRVYCSSWVDTFCTVEMIVNIDMTNRYDKRCIMSTHGAQHHRANQQNFAPR